MIILLYNHRTDWRCGKTEGGKIYDIYGRKRKRLRMSPDAGRRGREGRRKGKVVARVLLEVAFAYGAGYTDDV